ncbi:hypothetical protein ACWEPH_02565 [Nocardia beijingensis]
MASGNLTITADIKGRVVARDEVLAWEAKRIPKAARKIGLPVPAGDLASQKVAFADRKFALGAAEIRHRLAHDIRLSDAGAAITRKVSGGRRGMSICDLHVSGGNAQEFSDWFLDTGRDDYAYSMIAAHPDHFLIDTAPDGSHQRRAY